MTTQQFATTDRRTVELRTAWAATVAMAQRAEADRDRAAAWLGQLQDQLAQLQRELAHAEADLDARELHARELRAEAADAYQAAQAHVVALQLRGQL